VLESTNKQSGSSLFVQPGPAKTVRVDRYSWDFDMGIRSKYGDK
jgi:hypothetical protein